MTSPPPPQDPTADEPPQDNGKPNYVDLGPDYPSWSSWSNNPDDMHLNTYFNTDPEVPGLAESFNIPGLKPVIVKRNPSSGDQFLIMDNNGNFYLWNDLDSALFRFDFKGSTKTLEEVVDMVRTEEFGSESLVQQFDKDTGPSHPSGLSGPSGGAAAAA